MTTPISPAKMSRYLHRYYSFSIKLLEKEPETPRDEINRRFYQEWPEAQEVFYQFFYTREVSEREMARRLAAVGLVVKESHGSASST